MIRKMDNNKQEKNKNYVCTYKKCKAIKLQHALLARRGNFQFILVEKVKALQPSSSE